MARQVESHQNALLSIYFKFYMETFWIQISRAEIHAQCGYYYFCSNTSHIQEYCTLSNWGPEFGTKCFPLQSEVPSKTLQIPEIDIAVKIMFMNNHRVISSLALARDIPKKMKVMTPACHIFDKVYSCLVTSWISLRKQNGHSWDLACFILTFISSCIPVYDCIWPRRKGQIAHHFLPECQPGHFETLKQYRIFF